jgi:hypothetical protein
VRLWQGFCSIYVSSPALAGRVRLFATRRSLTPAHPPKSAEKLALEPGTRFDMYSGRAARSKLLKQLVFSEDRPNSGMRRSVAGR